MTKDIFRRRSTSGKENVYVRRASVMTIDGIRNCMLAFKATEVSTTVNNRRRRNGKFALRECHYDSWYPRLARKPAISTNHSIGQKSSPLDAYPSHGFTILCPQIHLVVLIYCVFVEAEERNGGRGKFFQSESVSSTFKAASLRRIDAVPNITLRKIMSHKVSRRRAD